MNKSERLQYVKSLKSVILKNAYEGFSKNGFKATHMQTIADKSGISVGHLYNFFPSKEYLFTAVVKQKPDLLDKMYPVRKA